MSQAEYAELGRIAVSAAREAGALLRSRFRAASHGVESKTTATDLVSDADRDAEALIGTIITAARPDDGMLGEEMGSASGTSGLTWVIDPLDGTVNFLHGIPQWCVSIACEDATGGVAAAIYDACRDELFTATRGGGAFLNDAPIRCSSCTDLFRAVVASGFPYRADARSQWGSVVAGLLPHVADIRRGGSAALDLAWTACGRLDGYAEMGLGPWDGAAGMLIASEAGARTSTIPAWGLFGDGVLAAPSAVYDALAILLRNAGIPA